MDSCTGIAMLAAAILADPAFCQDGAFRGMHYLGEIGHLETEFDRRTSVDLVVAQAVSNNQEVHIEGKDDGGKRWTAAVRIEGGAGWTDAWLADFDGNSRKDLLIASIFPPNGRCLDPVHLTFLMMDSAGRCRGPLIRVGPGQLARARDLRCWSISTGMAGRS